MVQWQRWMLPLVDPKIGSLPKTEIGVLPSGVAQRLTTGPTTQTIRGFSTIFLEREIASEFWQQFMNESNISSGVLSALVIPTALSLGVIESCIKRADSGKI